ncbi:DUF3783 domain-containing protein [Thermococcus paralvinellae]|uniref:DUF3783 domain-containing protein n=1 Tax=Thermococcus paralvinellae TaxID=582419 RepID=W0I5S4_9EURY|nr:DUF3783 domain-containing protein [Thermococcus paralvinellae]AHF79800.1 Hypothetical protein TES1_0406 [Thermococcus paralvinellae]
MIFLIGFNENEVKKIRETLSEFKVYEVPQYCRDWAVQSIVEKAEELKGSCDWHLKKFILMHNLKNPQIKEVLAKIKSLNLGRIIFATTTPASLTWKLKDLLEELIHEDEYFQELKRMRTKQSKLYLDIEKD